MRVAAVAPASAPSRAARPRQGRSRAEDRPPPRLARVVDPAVRAAAVAEPASAPAGGGVERGSGFEVHKFGGTCVGSSERISGCCDLLIESAKSGVKTFGIVSAMGVATKGEPKVTDCLINATDMAAARDPAWVEELVKLEHKHQTTAEALLTERLSTTPT